MPHSIESIATSRKKTKETIRVESLIPEDLRERAQALIELLQDYYSHLNEKGQTSYALNSINAERDIDTADEEYLDLIQKEIAISIPKNLLTDRVTLYKNLMRYYSLRGSTESIQLFFRILFNDNVEVYYPKDSMLIPSSGTWDNAFQSSAYISPYDQTKLESFQIDLGAGSGEFTVGENVYGATTHVSSVVREINNDILTVDSLPTGASVQFAKSENLLGETTFVLSNFTVSQSVTGSVTSAAGTVSALVDDTFLDVTMTSGTFTTSDFLQATGGPKRKIQSIQEIITIGLNTYASGDTVVGKISGATGTISSISTNVLEIAYSTLNSKNAPVPGFFQEGELVAATSGSSSNARRIDAINTKQTVTVTSGATFTVGWVVSGANSGARGTIESISTNTLVLKNTTGAFRNGENLLKDVDPTVYSAITATPTIRSYLTVSTFVLGETVSNGTDYGTVIDSTLTSITIGYATGTFATGNTIKGSNGLTRKATSAAIKWRLSLSNFSIGETITSGSKTAKVIRIEGNTVKVQRITNGPFVVTDALTGGTSGVIRKITTITAAASRAISAIYKDGQYVFILDLAKTGAGPDAFRAGELAIGQTSGEFATVVSYSTSDTTVNKLTLKNPSGNFTRGETVRAYHSDTGNYASGALQRQYTKGYYTSNFGFLDDTIKVQDSYFYQQFSYVIRTGNNVDVWKDSFNRLVHPAGFIFFGEILLLLELLNLKSMMPKVQPGLIYDDLPVLILLETFNVSALLSASLYRIALDVPTATSQTYMLKYFDGNSTSIYDAMTIQQADGFSQESPVGSAYPWDDYTIADVINNQITWNGVTLGANLI